MRLSFGVVEYYSIVEETELHVRKPVALSWLAWNLFEVADEVIGCVSDQAACVSVAVWPIAYCIVDL